MKYYSVNFLKKQKTQTFTMRCEISRYPSGSIESITHYNKHGEKHGTQMDFYENGKVWRIMTFSNGKQEGLNAMWFLDTGDMMFECVIKDGKRTEWKGNKRGWK